MLYGEVCKRYAVTRKPFSEKTVVPQLGHPVAAKGGMLPRPPGIEQEKVSIEDGSQEFTHEYAESSSALAQQQFDKSSKRKVMLQDAFNLAVPDEDVTEPIEHGAKCVTTNRPVSLLVVNPAGQKRKAETEVTNSQRSW